MTTLTTPRTDRATELGALPRAALITGGALLVAGTVLTPAFPADAESYLPVFADHADRVAWGGLLFLVGHALLVVPTALLARLGGFAGGAAAALAAGAVGFGSLGMLRMHEVALAETVGPEVGAEAVAAFGTSLPAMLGVLSGVALVNLGLLALAFALWRRGLVPVAAPVLVVLGLVGVMTGGDGTLLGIAGSTLLAAFLVLVSRVPASDRADG